MGENIKKSQVLYTYWRSSCSWRVRIALNHKKTPYDIKAVSLIRMEMEHNVELCLDGHTLVESLNIKHYLEETRPQQPLMFQDCFKRSKVMSSKIQPLHNPIVYVGEKKEEWVQDRITRGFRAVEILLSASAEKYDDYDGSKQG